MTQDNRGRVGGPRNVLYLTDQHDECDEMGCMDLLGADAPDGVDVLFVSFTETARERLATWRRHADAPPANVGVVSVETGGSSADGTFGEGGPTVRRVSDPSDLTGVGIAISEFLSAWADDGNRTVVCFDSLTALLQYLEPRRVFQFCNEITTKFETAGASAHFHITPEAHDRQVLSVLASLFDERVSAADLGHRRGERDRTDDGAPAGASGTADESLGAEPPSPAASTEDPSSPDEPSTADASGEGGFVFAGDEFSREATADSAGAETGDDDFTRGGADVGESGDGESGDGGPGDGGPAGESAEAASGDDRARDEVDDEPSDAGSDFDGGVPAESGAPGGPSGPSGADESGEDSGTVETEGDAESSGTAEPPATREPSATSGRSAIGPRSGGEDPEGPASDALIPRTTATVVGVVVMLLLMSFLAAAFPAPLVLDDSGAGDGVGADTVTPDDAATGADVDDADEPTATATATQSGAVTATQTATETSATTPTPGETTSGTSPSTDSPAGSDASTPTEPTATATATPTPEDGSILDPVTGSL